MNYNEERIRELGIEIMQHQKKIKELQKERDNILKNILTIDEAYILENKE